MQLPTLGRVVWYQVDGRNGLHYSLPAIVTVTRDSHPGDYPDGSPNPLPVPSSDTHVHITVFTPRGFGTRVGDGLPQTDAEFVGAPSITPGSGSYVEWDVAYDADASPRSWRWPTIVAAKSEPAGLPSVGP